MAPSFYLASAKNLEQYDSCNHLQDVWQDNLLAPFSQLCELAMTRFSAELRSKPYWWKLYQDPGTRMEWYEEALNKTWRVGPPSNNIEAGLSNHQVRKLNPHQ